MSNDLIKNNTEVTTTEPKKRYAIVNADALARLIDNIATGNRGNAYRVALETVTKELRVQQAIPVEELESQVTQRGFSRIDFKDRYGLDCSLQESSAAMFSAIWFGVNDTSATPIIQVNGEWVEVVLPEDAVVRGRMHLDKQGVAALLPHLLKFLATDEL